MATNYKVLGQASASAATDTTLYAVPAATQTVVSTLTACNRAGADTTIRVAIRPAGASIANQHYVVYDAVLDGNSTTAFTLGITLEATDVITVRAASASVSFNAFGSEVTL